MSALTYAERVQRARLYAAQVRARNAMGDRYDHHPSKIQTQKRRLQSAKLTERNFQATIK